MTALAHRIFLAPLRTDVDATTAQQHWTTVHAGVFAGTPGLRGYTQNRAPRADWGGRTHVCAESWFDDRDAERIAFSSEYYLSQVAVDEDRFVQRDTAWLAAVTTTRAARRMLRYRVLAFGHSDATAAEFLAAWDGEAVDVMTLHRAPPTGGRSTALGLWTDELSLAARAVAYFGPLSLLTEPVAVVAAPELPWQSASAALTDPEVDPP